MIEFEKKRDLLLESDEQANLLNTVPCVVAAAEGELELLLKSSLKTPVTDGISSGTTYTLSYRFASEAMSFSTLINKNRAINTDVKLTC